MIHKCLYAKITLKIHIKMSHIPWNKLNRPPLASLAPVWNLGEHVTYRQLALLVIKSTWPWRKNTSFSNSKFIHEVIYSVIKTKNADI